uniref:Acytransferase n=1 Tax=Anaeromyces contortus TaxID=2170304 RepID=A0A2S1TZG3_9FUNG|nr:Acytransferase [Anaeromyces contortus]
MENNEYKLIDTSSDKEKDLSENESNSFEVIEIKNEQQEQLKNNQKRLYWADCLRIYSMFNIILFHCANYSYEKQLVMERNSNFIYVCIYNCFTAFGVPVFVMLSGTFFLNPNKPFTFSRLLKKNILRLFTSFYFWSAVNAFFNFIKEKGILSIFSLDFIKEFMIGFLKGEEYLWFILMITGCYLCIPFLRLFSNDVLLMKYFLGLWIFWGSLVPLIRDTLKICNIEALTDIFTTWIDRWHFNFTLEYIGYFVCGYYVFNYINIKSIKIRVILYILCILNFILYTSFSIWYELNNPSLFAYLRGDLSIFVIIYSIILEIFFKHEIGRINFSDKAIKVINKLSTLSFGMYLTHMVVRSLYFDVFNINQEDIGNIIHYSPLFGVPIIFILISGLSFLICYIISKIPILKRYVL